MALANDPELLLLGEPTTGMVPNERGALMALTSAIACERVPGAVLFTEHVVQRVYLGEDE